MTHTYGLILAGGRSSRMKTDKAMLQIEGQTLLQHNNDKLQALGLDEIFVSGSRCGGIVDQWPEKGPLGGIFSVISATQLKVGSTILVVPVDMPLISQQSLKRLIAFTQQTHQSCFYQSTWLPICIYVDEHVNRQLQEFPHNYEQCSVRNFILKISAAPLQLQDHDELINCNTQDDWRWVLNHRLLV